MTPPHFYIFVIVFPLKRIWPFIWTNLIFLHQRIICTKFDWIWSAGSGEEDLKKKNQCIFYISLLSPLGEELSPSFEQTWIPSTEGWFVPLVKIGPVLWKRSRKCKSLQTDGRRTTSDQKSSLQLLWGTVCNNETVCNKLLHTVPRMETLCNKDFFVT
jgi:hypothetical protein